MYENCYELVGVKSLVVDLDKPACSSSGQLVGAMSFLVISFACVCETEQSQLLNVLRLSETFYSIYNIKP